jgi:hypothetical protein
MLYMPRFTVIFSDHPAGYRPGSGEHPPQIWGKDIEADDIEVAFPLAQALIRQAIGRVPEYQWAVPTTHV